MTSRTPIVLVCIAALLWVTAVVESDPICVVLAWLSPPSAAVAPRPLGHEGTERLPNHPVRVPLPSRAPPIA